MVLVGALTSANTDTRKHRGRLAGGLNFFMQVLVLRVFYVEDFCVEDLCVEDSPASSRANGASYANAANLANAEWRAR
jgi:hypothetical protein